MSLFLNPDELHELTGFKTRRRQCAELARQGRRFTTRADGYPLVPRSQFDEVTPERKRRTPRFDLINKAS